uniref:Uncharacterized protein n=1 Tax=Chromera velia CCMP2878 TaxID=1169474 RepID=A0A0G4HBN2_9ALVE|eukprot:Cvel_26021.t1-p1 / transcript=Cvel_26021.t1 / gene=Cvel_26021 / organism=Chromera_velia_CCMP2878 / gene_product=hypothetical protein / transcript_product=hypothetical protein / location=Cvel_scaffold3030:504-1244(-) / protein_length=247 / sequence_SO=supercontig / SO=protein_coding / is_pseudo=false
MSFFCSIFGSLWTQADEAAQSTAHVEPPKDPFARWRVPFPDFPGISTGLIMSYSPEYNPRYKNFDYKNTVPNLLGDGFLELCVDLGLLWSTQMLRDLGERLDSQPDPAEIGQGADQHMRCMVETMYQLQLIRWVLSNRKRTNRKAYTEAENREAFSQMRKLSKSAESFMLELQRELAGLRISDAVAFNEHYEDHDWYTLSGGSNDSRHGDPNDFLEFEPSVSGLATEDASSKLVDWLNELHLRNLQK